MEYKPSASLVPRMPWLAPVQSINPWLALLQAPLESTSAEYTIPGLALFSGSSGEHQCRVQSVG